ncbi:molybdopterin-guanine dinucleotide biosynthesis protein B [Proteiniborus sp.]|uniref:molybdopterin-guanine dinucleotide biosynthesis protein B n=1 Tax=Proteiniborus sp. TaxID=2079015 RepID=UPI00333153F2
MKIFSVYGYSKSGKTTTIEMLIRELKKRGYSVGTVKEIHYEEFTMEVEGSNTDRHRKAGADLVSARGLYETNILYKERLPMEDILKYYNQDFVILEGVTDFDVPKILCAGSIKDINKRMNSSVFALSGVISNGLLEYNNLPVINAMNNIEMLTDLVESTVQDWESK